MALTATHTRGAKSIDIDAFIANVMPTVECDEGRSEDGVCDNACPRRWLRVFMDSQSSL